MCIRDRSGGAFLREDGPQTPADPRYAPRAMMMFALVEILCQAYAQINGAQYRMHQGKEGNPRVLKHLVLTYPSAMVEEERRVYVALAGLAELFAGYVPDLGRVLPPYSNAEDQKYADFLL